MSELGMLQLINEKNVAGHNSGDCDLCGTIFFY